ncbi:MAG: sulfurtransferase [Gammaproteobacteria bacterium]|nr:sulfurtransferase [Gammaproteobacteria bacterium]
MNLHVLKILLIGITGLAILGGCSDTTSPQEIVDEPAPTMDSLVTAEWLKEHIGDPDLIVIDASVIVKPDDAGSIQLESGRATYEAGHIPSARFADLLGEFSDADSELQFNIPSPGQFAAAMGALGVGDDSRVVLYDTTGLSWAARVWWMLRWIGFDRAALLDGGLTAWTAAGGELSAEPVNPLAKSLTVKLRPQLIAYQDEVRASTGIDDVHLVDAMPEIHYRGEWTMYDRPGHIPGASNVPVTALFNEAGRFRSGDELSQLFGDDKQARTITYCGGGIAASANAFALVRSGFTDVAVYDGSLAEWAANPDNPMVVKAED